MKPVYDAIGVGYSAYRKPEPRVAVQLAEALGDAQSVLNVGAGVGSYEHADRAITAVEPSSVMIAQRPVAAAPVVQAVAENLPFADDSFDAVQAVLTLHHWSDQAAGLSEVCRVARDRVVFLSWVGHCTRFWLFDYFPEIEDMDDTMFPSVEWLSEVSGWRLRETVVPIPVDCVDGFMCAYWARPAAYLDPGVRAAISSFSRLQDVEQRIQVLAADIESGRWHDCYGHWLAQNSVDFGYRVIALSP